MIGGHLLVLREQWRVLIVSTVLAASAAAGMWFLSPRQYQAHLQLYASYESPSGGIPASDAYSVLLLSQQQVTSDVELVTSDRVLEEVSQRLQLPETTAELAGQIQASSPPQTVLIDVTVTGTSATQVAAIANTVGTVVQEVAADLDAPTAPSGTGRMTLQVVQPAAVPTAPSGIRLRTALLLGAVAGAVVGLAAASLRDSLRRSVRSVAQLQALTSAPTLGTVSFDRAARKRPLIAFDAAGSARADEFRRLRTAVDRLDAGPGARVVLVGSAVADEGRTTTVCNLAAALARIGRRVVVVDADLRRSGVARLLGLEEGRGLADVLTGRSVLEQALRTAPTGGFDLLAGGNAAAHPTDLLASTAMRDVLAKLRADYDLVLIDAPAVLCAADAALLAPSTDGVLLVCRYERTTPDKVSAAVMAFRTVSVELIGTVFTMVPRRGPRAHGTDPTSAGPTDRYGQHLQA